MSATPEVPRAAIVAANTGSLDRALRWRATLNDAEGAELAEGRGPTAKAARDDLLDVVCDRLRVAGEDPLFIAVTPTLGAVVYGAWDSWAYRIVRGMRSGGSCLGWNSRRQAETMARRHLAQDVWEATEDGGLSVIDPDDREGRYDHAHWLTWQRAYAAAKARGLNDAACRAEADRA